MKAILYESPGHTFWNSDIYVDTMRESGFIVNQVNKLENAIEALRAGDIDVAVIHQGDYADVDAMRSIAPSTLYMGYSAHNRKSARPNTAGDIHLAAMLKHYDCVVFPGEFASIFRIFFPVGK